MSDGKYEFNLADPESWAKMPKPLLPEKFVKETLRIGGLNAHGQPRFKWVWGMSEEVHIESDGSYPSGWYLKYQLGSNERHVGFVYLQGGKRHVVKKITDVPLGCIGTPYKVIDQIGTPRWILEEWRDEGDCNGMFDKAGYYFHRRIEATDEPTNPETMMHPYREPNYNDLEILQGYVNLTATLTDKDIREGVAKQREKEADAEVKAKADRKEMITEGAVEYIEGLRKGMGAT